MSGKIEFDSTMAKIANKDRFIRNYGKEALWTAYNEGSNEACEYLIEGYSNGVFDIDDDNEHFELCNLLAKEGDYNAMFSIGMYHLFGIEGFPLGGDSKMWFNMAAESGHPNGRIMASIIDYSNGDIGTCIEVFLKNHERSEIARMALGVAYWNEDLPSNDSIGKAIELWRTLGELTFHDIDMVIKNVDKGKRIDILELIEEAGYFIDYNK